MKKHISYCRFFTMALYSIAFIYSGCKADLGIEPIKKGKISDPVSGIRVKPAPGGAVIFYSLPQSEDFRYVKAKYQLDNGKILEAKSSLYIDSIVIEGFGKGGTYEVQLYSVSVGDIESAPSTVAITTLAPPIQQIADDLRSEAAFYGTYGGVNINLKNETRSPVVLFLLRQNESGAWENVDTVYTSDATRVVRIRGLSAGTYTYGAVVQDRWQNNSDTIKKTLNPLQEIELPKNLWQMTPIALGKPGGDWDDYNGSYGSKSKKYAALWDQATGTNNANEVWFSTPPLPMYFTIDLGKQSILSRIKVWPRMSANTIYNGSHLSKFEVYGTNDLDQTNVTMDRWTFLGHFEGYRPSGLPFGQNPTSEDLAYGRAGEEWDFEVGAVPLSFRYLRFKLISTWMGVEDVPVFPSAIIITEITLWGQQN